MAIVFAGSSAKSVKPHSEIEECKLKPQQGATLQLRLTERGEALTKASFSKHGQPRSLTGAGAGLPEDSLSLPVGEGIPANSTELLDPSGDVQDT